ncbi:ComEC/Rec2 family competence protein [Sphingomonas montana]|uniref:ComEC/Rec2 family competence protein n=1 Tax=Sphingomonas montana TaxID=1843236 RepID=UPI00096EC7E0|nr:ComEC/Rec2 family competence protein [Sphingomonas montana]
MSVERWLEAERDQLVLWCPVALACGITAWFLLPDAGAWTVFLLLAGGTALAALAVPGGGRAARGMAVFAGLCAIGCALIWLRAERVAAPVLARTTVATMTARVLSVDPLPARALVRVMLAPDVMPDALLPPRVRVNIADADVPAGLAPGARLALRARLMPPADAAVPGGYAFARVAWFQRIGATGKALPGIRVVQAAPVTHDGLAATRARLSAHIQARLPGAAGGFATALATGDQGALPLAEAEAMRRSGLAHLLSVSGLHVTAVVATTMLIVLRLLAFSPWAALRFPLPLIAAGCGAGMGVGYTLLTGAEVPTIRSCVAAILVLAGIAIGREAVTLRLVAAGALFVLALWPEAVTGASSQLSFAAVTAIVAFAEWPLARRLSAANEAGMVRRWGRALAMLLATGVVVEIALMPIALYHFHKAGLYGAAANIVAIPLTTFVIMPAEAMALLLDTAGLGRPAWWIAGMATDGLLWLSRAVAVAPGSVQALPAMPDGAYAAMVAGGLWIALWRTRWRRLGLVPLAVGATWALATPAPDLLVTGDGRHLALRGRDGSLALLRPRAGDYVRGLLGENAGVSAEAGEFESVAGGACSADLCVADIVRGGRTWRLLATRSAYLVAIAEMNRACAAADIVVSDRYLPRSCTPRWIRADRGLLARTGGLAIDLTAAKVRTVRRAGDAHPWVPVAVVRTRYGRRDRQFRPGDALHSRKMRGGGLSARVTRTAGEEAGQ